MSSKTRRIISIAVSIGLAVLLLVLILTIFTGNPKKMTEDELYRRFEEGEILAVRVEGIYTVRVLETGSGKDGADKDLSGFPKNADYSLNISSRSMFRDEIRKIITMLKAEIAQFEQDYAAGLLFVDLDKEAAVSAEEYAEWREDQYHVQLDIYQARLERMEHAVTYDNPNALTFWDIAYPVLIIAAVVFFGWFIISRMAQQNNQNINFGKSKARVNENVKTRFTDVAGADEEKEELREIIEFLKNPAKFSELGARIPHGVLLVGPPGTGKTLFAKAVAGEAGVPFFSISGSDFVEMFVGVGASRVRDLFDQAKKNTPCIVFIDEIDAVGRQRGAGLGGGHDEREQTLNQLLVQMDGFETNSGIIVMAATNRSDILDPALLRPGRFDRTVYVHKPDVRGREAILRIHARNKPFSPEVDFAIIARITVGLTGADLENILNEAAILAVRADRKRVAMVDITEGINKVLMGPQKKSRLITEKEKRETAYHEAGHAILASKLKRCDPVQEVTIIPRGHCGGYTLLRPETDDMFENKAELLDDIAMTLGGRVAEELIIRDIGNGSSGDIRSVTATAHKMVAEWGMSDVIGPVYYGSDGEIFVGKNYQSTRGYSESMAALVDAEANKIIKECLEKARKVLGENIPILHSMARVLLEKETIHSDEVQMLVDGKSAEEVINYIDKKYNPDAAHVKKTAPKPKLEGFDDVKMPEVKPLTDDKDKKE